MNLEMIGELIYWFILYSLILYAVDDLTRKSKVMSYVLMVAPLFFLPLLMQTVFNDWFNILKFLTLMIGPIYATIVRFNWSHKWLLIIGTLLLPINIVEAVLKDGQLGNLLNVVSGIIVIGLLPTLDRLTIVQEKHSPRQISYPMHWLSIALFTIWHMCFIYGFPSGRGYTGDYTLVNIPMLLIPILTAFIHHPQYWLQARAYTLAFNVLMLEATVVNHPNFWPLTPNIYNANIYNVVALVTFVLILAGWFYMARYLREDYNQTIFGSLLKLRTSRSVADVRVSQ